MPPIPGHEVRPGHAVRRTRVRGGVAEVDSFGQHVLFGNHPVAIQGFENPSATLDDLLHVRLMC